MYLQSILMVDESKEKDSMAAAEDWYKKFSKKTINETKEKFEKHPAINRRLSDEEFKEMYEDYTDSGLAFNEYMKARKFR